MERWRTLAELARAEGICLFLTGLLVACQASHPLGDEPDGEEDPSAGTIMSVFEGRVDPQSQRLIFTSIPESWIDSSGKVFLDLRFADGAYFPPTELHLSAEDPQGPPIFLNAGGLSRWRWDHLGLRLRVQIGKLSFADKVSLKGRMKRFKARKVDFELRLRAPSPAVWGALLFEGPPVAPPGAPIARIDRAHPPEPILRSSSITFFVSAQDPRHGLECSLDGSPFSECASPTHYDGLEDGTHVFEVRAVGTDGHPGASVRYAWEIGREVETRITSKEPAQPVTSSKIMTLAFESKTADSFECRLDGSAFTRCASPMRYTSLSERAHLFEVRGLSKAGTPGTAVSHGWTVDRTAPQVTLEFSDPEWSPTARDERLFRFLSTETATFTCRLDGDRAESCSSPWTARRLSDGSHQVTITATDLAGNRGPELSLNWIVSTRPGEASPLSLSGIGRTTAEIRWSTSVPATSQAVYGLSKFDQSTPVTATYQTNYAVVLSGLTPFTFYRVRGRSVDRDGREILTDIATFRTLR